MKHRKVSTLTSMVSDCFIHRHTFALPLHVIFSVWCLSGTLIYLYTVHRKLGGSKFYANSNFHKLNICTVLLGETRTTLKGIGKKHIAMCAVLCYFYFDWDILHIGLL